MSETQQQKPSIFLCGKCKSEQINVPRKPRTIVTDINEVKLMPAKTSYQDKKYVIAIGKKHIGFGSRTMSDYTLNQDDERRKLYIDRHYKREHQFWDFDNKDNYRTASFWARMLLWEEKDIFSAIKNIESKTGIVIKFTQNTIERHQKKLAKSVKKSGEDEDE